MKHFLNSASDICDCTMWLLVLVLEVAFFYAIFMSPEMIRQIAQVNWLLAATPVFLPALALAIYGTPFERLLKA